jgi:hypothetical protein
MLNLRTRLLRREARMPESVERCRGCGGPNPRGPTVRLIAHDLPELKCSACGRDVDERGRAMGVITKRIILEPT